MSKYNLSRVSIILDSSANFNADIRALWDDVCHGCLKMADGDLSHVYGLMEYDDNLKPCAYTILLLSDEEIAALSDGGYAKYTATSTESAEDASNCAWSKATTADRDYYGDLEHFIDNPNGTFTCEVYVSIDIGA